MIERGQGGAYLVLFSEIGFVILVTTLAGALGGHWIDGQLHTTPIFIVAGLLAGLGIAARYVYGLIQRFLAKFE